MVENLSEREPSSSWCSDAVLIAAASASGYLLAFVWQAAYCSAFGLPLELVKPDLGTVLLVGGVGLFFSSVFWLLWILWIAAQKENPEGFVRWGARLLTGLFIVGVPIYAYNGNWAMAKNTAGIMFIIMFLVLQSFLAKRSPPLSVSTIDGSFFNVIRRHLGRSMFALVVIVTLSALLFWVAGEGRAFNQRTFSVLLSDTNLVLATIYNDTAVCFRVDAAERRATGGYVLLKLETAHEFEQRTLGRLKFPARHRPTPYF